MKSKITLIILVLVVLIGNAKAYAVDPITEYSNAWREQNSEARLKIIQSIWSDASTYQDPTVKTKGVAELNAMIEKFHKDFPGAILVGDVILSTGNFRSFNWQIFDASKKPLFKGRDTVELGADGKIIKVVGFFEQ